MDLMSYEIAVHLWEVRAKYHKNKVRQEQLLVPWLLVWPVVALSAASMAWR